MNRLLCGDVGSGKTVLALLSACLNFSKPETKPHSRPHRNLSPAALRHL